MVTKNQKGVGERRGGESEKDRTGAKEQGREAYDQRLTGLRRVEEKKVLIHLFKHTECLQIKWHILLKLSQHFI